MALSDDEQRILRQIEQELQNDSKFAQAVSPSGLYTHSVRTVRWAVVGLAICLGLLIALLQVHFLAAFAVFVVMLGLVVVIERNARAMGKAGIQDMAGAIRKARLSAGRRFP
jgi:Flp pilus assembly protein TadB